MEFDFAALSPKDCYKLMVSTIVPRPIAWVVTQSAAGIVNAAPYSFFNGVGGDPPLISISIEGRNGGPRKDTAANIRASGQFVVNLVDAAASREMVVTAIDFAPDVSEVAEAGLTTTPSKLVKPPRIIESPVTFECETYQIVELPNDRDLVIGRILIMHIADNAVLDEERCYIRVPNGPSGCSGRSRRSPLSTSRGSRGTTRISSRAACRSAARSRARWSMAQS